MKKVYKINLFILFFILSFNYIKSTKSTTIEDLIFEGQLLEKEYNDISEINHFHIYIKEGFTPKYIRILIKEKNSDIIKNHIISFYQQDSKFTKRTQLIQSLNSETELLLNKEQIKNEFYFAVECEEYPCSYTCKISEEENIEINLENRYSYTYYVTEETKEMNFVIHGKPELSPNLTTNGNNVVNIWAKGNKNITSDLNIENKQKHSEYNVYIIKLDNLDVFTYSFNVTGDLGDLINVGVSFFDGSFNNLYYDVIDNNINEFSGFLKKGIKEVNCFKIKKSGENEDGEDGSISFSTFNNYDIDLMTLITQYEEKDYFKKCLSITNSNEGFYSFQYIKQNNQKSANIYLPQILGIEYSRYILEGDTIQLIPIKPDYDFKYLTYHINIGQGKKINAFINSCDTYPLCDVDSTTIEKSTKIQSFNSFTITFSKKEIDEFSSSPIDVKQNILLIQCKKGTRSKHTNGASKNLRYCLIKLNMFTDKNKFNIEPFISNYRYIQKSNEDNFIVGSENNIAEYMTMNYEILSGNTSFIISDINEEKIKHYHHNNKHLYIIYDKECSVKIKASENSFYHINYILKNNYAIDYSFIIGANYLFRLDKKAYENIILSNPTNFYDLLYSKDNPVFIGFYPYKNNLKVNNTFDMYYESIELNEIDNFYQDITNNYVKNASIVSEFPFYNYTIINTEEENCMVDISFFKYDNDSSDNTNNIILSNNSPRKFKFSSEYNILKFSYPYVDADKNIMIHFNSINGKQYKINIFLNDKVYENHYDLNINYTILINYEYIKTVCKYDNQICKISFNIESEDAIIEVKIVTDNSQDGEGDESGESDTSEDNNGKDENQKKGFSKLAIVLIVISAVILLIIIILVVLFIINKRKGKNLNDNIKGVSFSDSSTEKKNQLLNEL